MLHMTISRDVLPRMTMARPDVALPLTISVATLMAVINSISSLSQRSFALALSKVFGISNHSGVSGRKQAKVG
jgi:hypothetical protein